MEYDILGIAEDASIDEAKRAIHKIRLTYHPDKLTDASEKEKDKSQKFLILAEKAYKRIKDKQKVNDTISLMIPSFHKFSSPIIPRDVPNFVDWPVMHENRGQIHSSSYSYSNINGKVTESGKINGRKMTDKELYKCRKQSDSLF